MASSVEWAAVMVTVLFCVNASTALICYDCNSEYDPRCGDPFQPYSIGEVNCSKQDPLEHLKDKYKPTLCRKTIQKTYGKTRIVRGCGYIPDERDERECIKRSGTHDVQATYCACTTDLCNGAPSVVLRSKDFILSTFLYTFTIQVTLWLTCSFNNIQYL